MAAFLQKKLHVLSLMTNCKEFDTATSCIVQMHHYLIVNGLLDLKKGEIL